MRLSFTECLGRDPSRYAQKVLNACGLKNPPICEKTVADFLKIQIEEFTNEDIFEFTGGDPERQREFLRNVLIAPSFLKREGDKKTLIVYKKIPRERKRLCITHEFGHELPWHKTLNYLCKKNPLDIEFRNRIEREAFVCGAEYLMPTEPFVRDLLSMDTSIATVSALHGRYVSSIEATSIRYASLHPGFCSIVFLEPALYNQGQTTCHDSTVPGQLRFSFDLEPAPRPKAEVKNYPYRVKFSAKSRRFPQYIPSGRGINEQNPILATKVGSKPMQMEIPAAAFGSSAKCVYHAECMSLGNTGKIMALLWLPDRHKRFDF